MHVEVGGSSGSNCSINDSDIRGLIGKGSGATMSFSEWYGASAVQPPSLQYTAYGSVYTAATTGKNFAPAAVRFTSSAARSIVTTATTEGSPYGLQINDYGIVVSGQFTGAGVSFLRTDPNFTWANSDSSSVNFRKNHGTSAGQHYIKIYYGSSLLLTSNTQQDANTSGTGIFMGNTGVSGIVGSRSSAGSWRVEYYA